MKKIYSTICLLFSISTAAFAQCGWIDINHGTGGLETWGVTTDAANNAYLSGVAIDTIAFGNDTTASNAVAYFIYKFNTNGAVQWVTQFNLPSVTGQYFVPPVIYQKNSALYVAGNFYDSLVVGDTTFTAQGTDYFMLKLDLNGNVLWAKNYGGSNYINNSVFGIVVDSNSQVYLTGDFADTVTFGSTTLVANVNQGQETYLLKTDSNGNVIWAKQSVTTSSAPVSRGWGITLDNNDNVIISGNFNTEIMFGSQTFNADNTITPEFYPSNPYIAKFDSSGNCLWINGGQGRTGFGPDYTVVTDKNNNVYTTGDIDSALSFNGTSLLMQNGAFFYCKYSPAGNLIWSKQTATGLYTGPATSTSLLIDKSANLWMSGWTDTSTQMGNFFLPNYGVFVAKLDTNGTILNALVSQGLGGENYYEALDGNGSLYFTSTSEDTASFNGITATTDTGVSAYALVKYCTSSAGTAYYPMFGYHHIWDVDGFPYPAEITRTSIDEPFPYHVMDAYGDTTISSKQYFKAKIAQYDTSAFLDTTFYFREDTATQQVWIRTNNSDSEKLLYDFSLQKGDGVYLTFAFHDSSLGYYYKTGWYYVDSVKTVNIYAGPRKALFLSNPYNTFKGDSTEIKWIEQIGSTVMPDYLQRDLTQPGEYPYNWNFYFILLCSYNDNGKMYHNHLLDAYNGAYATPDSCSLEYEGGINRLSGNNNQVSVYPNPSSGEINIVSEKTIDDLKVFNLLGQLVYESQPKQIQFTFELKDEEMYFVTVTAGDEISTNKVVVSK